MLNKLQVIGDKNEIKTNYYLIRLLRSGYTNIGGLEVYTFTGIVGSLYIGTLIYLIINKFIYHRGKCILQIYSLIAMTIMGIIFTITGLGHTINYNLSYKHWIRYNYRICFWNNNHKSIKKRQSR